MRVIASLALVAIVGCTGDGPPSATGGAADATTSTTRRPDAPDVVLRVGLCFDGADLAAGVALVRADVAPLDCGQPHDYELFATLVHPANERPSDDALFAYTSDQCLARFERYVGKAYEESLLDIAPLFPDRLGWESGDRELACAAYRTDFEPLVGSVSQSGR